MLQAFYQRREEMKYGYKTYEGENSASSCFCLCVEHHIPSKKS
jgi:hypothetical protein